MSPRSSLFVKGNTIKLFYLSKICGECMRLLTLFKAQKTVIALFQYLQGFQLQTEQQIYYNGGCFCAFDYDYERYILLVKTKGK